MNKTLNKFKSNQTYINVTKNSIHKMSTNYTVEVKAENGLKIEVRVKLNGEVKGFDHFKRVIQNKLTRAFKANKMADPQIKTMHYTLTNSTGYFEIYGDEEVQDFNEERLISKIIINKDEIKTEEKKDEIATKGLTRTYESAMAKLTISNFPYTFDGTTNLNHFMIKVENYCKMNQIETEVLIKLILNGKIITGKAFDFLQTKVHIIYELRNEEQLQAIWKAMKDKFGRSNQVIHLKQKLQKLRQNKMNVKEFVDKFKQIRDELELEIKLEQKDGIRYVPLSEYELTEIFMKGLQQNLQEKFIDEMMAKYGTTNVELSKLDEILTVEIEKEKYRKLLQNETVSNKENANGVNQVELSDKFGSLKQEIINELRTQMNNNNNYKPKCRFGTNCRFGLQCKFYHNHKEKAHFKSRNSNMNAATSNPTRNKFIEARFAKSNFSRKQNFVSPRNKNNNGQMYPIESNISNPSMNKEQLKGVTANANQTEYVPEASANF